MCPSRLLKNWVARLTLERESDSCAVEKQQEESMRGSDLRTGDVFLCRPRTEGACEPSAAADPLHHQPGPRRPRWRVWKAVCGRRATLDRPRAAAASTSVAGVLQHPFGAPVDGTVTLQSALSLVCRSWRG